MEIEIISFGKIAEIVSNQTLSLQGISNTDDFRSYLEENYPILAKTTYKFALNQNIIQNNQQLKHKDVIAIMPPFSGG